MTDNLSLNEKIRSDIKSLLESLPNKRFSTKAIKKHVKRYPKNKDISDWRIEQVLRDMDKESVLIGEYDYRKNKKFYSLPKR